MTDLAYRVAAEYDAEHLQPPLDALGAHGVAGESKSLIFAADGPKPRIVLRDAGEAGELPTELFQGSELVF